MSGKITVIGDGAMGTLCAIILAENGHSVRLWSAFSEAAEKLAQARENKKYLPGPLLSDSIEITGIDDGVIADSSLAVIAVPTQFIRSVLERLKCEFTPELPICSVAKGIENKTLLRPTQVILDVLDGSCFSSRGVASLSGPSIAPEVANKLPATVAVASSDEELGQTIQNLFNRPYFRVYTNDDLIGVELAGASKNVIAIAAGILDGLGIGDNAKAALVTRGLVEITRLGLALGGKAETFSGLAGVGDLITTCISPMGRNRSFGEAIGKGKSAKQALSETESVVEGVATTESLIELASTANVEMPITQSVYKLIFEGNTPSEAISGLMNRPLKSE